MVFKPVGIDETGKFAPRADARLETNRAFDRNRANHSGTQTSATISDFTEATQDAVASLLQAAGGVTLSYNDAGNVLTVSSTGTGGVTDPEVVRDTIGAALLGVGLITVAVNDAADTIVISTSATMNSTDAALRDRATHTGVQPISSITGLQTQLTAMDPTTVQSYTIAATSYTFGLADAGKVGETTAATTTTLTVPNSTSTAFPIGTLLEVYQGGVGQVVLAADTGVTIRTPAGGKIAAQYGTMSLRKRAANEWVASGYTTT